MEMDSGKLFIGGISWETTEERLTDFFRTFGEVVQAVIMKDRITGRSRGFGFIMFSSASVAERVLKGRHIIDGRAVEAKRAVPRVIIKILQETMVGLFRVRLVLPEVSLRPSQKSNSKGTLINLEQQQMLW